MCRSDKPGDGRPWKRLAFVDYWELGNKQDEGGLWLELFFAELKGPPARFVRMTGEEILVGAD